MRDEDVCVAIRTVFERFAELGRQCRRDSLLAGADSNASPFRIMVLLSFARRYREIILVADQSCRPRRRRSPASRDAGGE